MARKRRAPSPPPPPPPQEDTSEESSSGEEEEAAEGTPLHQKPPQKPKPPSAAAANDDDDAGSSEGGEEEEEAEESSDSEVDAQAFQLRQVARSPSKPPVPAFKPESDADEEEEQGASSDSEPDNLEPVQKAAAKKPKAEAEKKRPAPEPTLSGKAKKAKAKVEKVAPEPTPSGNAKKAKAGAEKAAPEPTPSGKAKKPRAEPEKAAPVSSPSSKSEKPARWKTEDEIKILEALVAHVKSQGVYPKPDDLIAAVGDSLDRKNCSRSEMYEKVRRLKQRYGTTAKKVASTGALPGKDDDLRMYKLSEAVWGENAMEVASASTSQNNGALSKNKGQTTANENGATLTGSKRGKATKEEIDEDTKNKSSKEATSTATPAKSKKQGKHKDELDEDAKSGISKETTNTATQNGSTLISRKRGETHKERMDGDAVCVMPKEATTATQNSGTLTQSKKGEAQKEETDRDANVQGIHRGFDELQSLYPNLASYVERIEAQHPCGETLKRAFECIGDGKACALESKIKKQNVAEVKTQIHRADTKKEVANILIGLLE